MFLIIGIIICTAKLKMKNKKKFVQKKILILGATSFIGFNLCLELFEKNFQILGVTSLKINKEKKEKLKILRKKKNNNN